MESNTIIPRINLKEIKPQVKRWSKEIHYTWEINSSIPTRAFLYISKDGRRFFMSWYISHESSSPIMSIESKYLHNGLRINNVWFEREITPQNINSITEKADGTIKIVLWGIKTTNLTTYRPISLTFNPDGTIEVTWHKYVSRTGDIFLEGIYDKQGNLLYLYYDYPSQNFCEIKLLSPGTYSAHSYFKKGTRYWACLMMKPKIIRI